MTGLHVWVCLWSWTTKFRGGTDAVASAVLIACCDEVDWRQVHRVSWMSASMVNFDFSCSKLGQRGRFQFSSVLQSGISLHMPFRLRKGVEI
jgi:hypothetical protein